VLRVSPALPVLVKNTPQKQASAQNDGFGSRSIDPMGLYHNQVTRAHGSFSERMFQRSSAISWLVQENISAPCRLYRFSPGNPIAHKYLARFFLQEASPSRIKGRNLNS
jgi:hypothetical protein